MRLFILALILSSGCHLSSDPDQGELQRMAVRRAQWRSQHLHSYTFDYRVVAQVYFPPVRIDVINDHVDRLTSLETDQVLVLTPGAHWPTVDSLFADVERALAEPDAKVEITYDDARGYPVRISSAKPIPDASSEILATNLHPLARPN